MDIMTHCIPKCVIPPRRNILWMSKSIRAAMLKRNRCFRRAKTSRKDSDLLKYKTMRNLVVKFLRDAKRKHLRSLSKPGSTQFWKTLHVMTKKNESSIPTLRTSDSVADTDILNTTMLNEQFCANFNNSVPPLILMTPSISFVTLTHARSPFYVMKTKFWS